MSGPRWSVRVRLTALYGALFLVSGAALLGVTYVLVADRLHSSTFYATVQGGGAGGQVSGPVVSPRSGQQSVIVHATGGSAIGPGPGPGPGPVAAPPDAQAIFLQVQAAAARQRADSLRQLRDESLVALAIMAVASMGLGWLLAGRALRPVRDMTFAARRISEYNLHERLPDRGPADEIGVLAVTINDLLARLEAAFDSQRQFVTNASHELRTPLTLERAILEVALADPAADADSLRAACERTLDIGARHEELIEALLTLARSQRGLDQQDPLDLAEITGEAVAASRRAAQPHGIEIRTELAAAPTQGDARLVERLATNLIDNAVRHNRDDGWVEVQTLRVEGRPTLRVANTGAVIPPSEVDRLLQPFQRLVPDRTNGGDGLGLGLSIVAAITAAHGGSLRVRARPEGGLLVDVGFAPPPAG